MLSSSSTMTLNHVMSPLQEYSYFTPIGTLAERCHEMEWRHGPVMGISVGEPGGTLNHVYPTRTAEESNPPDIGLEVPQGSRVYLSSC